MNTHTPGPYWVQNESALSTRIIDETGWRVALCGHTQQDVDDLRTGYPGANAIRIVRCLNALDGVANPSAVPACIEALRKVVRGWDEILKGTLPPLVKAHIAAVIDGEKALAALAALEKPDNEA